MRDEGRKRRGTKQDKSETSGDKHLTRTIMVEWDPIIEERRRDTKVDKWKTRI
jgi:hypothetical protein